MLGTPRTASLSPNSSLSEFMAVKSLTVVPHWYTKNSHILESQLLWLYMVDIPGSDLCANFCQGGHVLDEDNLALVVTERLLASTCNQQEREGSQHTRGNQRQASGSAGVTVSPCSNSADAAQTIAAGAPAPWRSEAAGNAHGPVGRRSARPAVGVVRAGRAGTGARTRKGELEVISAGHLGSDKARAPTDARDGACRGECG